MKNEHGYERRVVCAANRTRGYPYAVVLGPRHWDPTMRKHAEQLFGNTYGDIEWEQGFIDQWGKFMTRQEAWKVADDARQIRQIVGGNNIDGGYLFSENLY